MVIFGSFTLLVEMKSVDPLFIAIFKVDCKTLIATLVADIIPRNVANLFVFETSICVKAVQ